jgi:hypothetical protein
MKKSARTPARQTATRPGWKRYPGRSPADYVDRDMRRKIDEIAAELGSAKFHPKAGNPPGADVTPDNQQAIEWPSDQQLRQISNRLEKIKCVGMACERKADYFNSGELAFLIQEIIDATNELYRKLERLNARNS